MNCVGFILRSTRDLATGEEITICYDPFYDNDRLFVQYGFVLSGNPNDFITAWPLECCSSTFHGLSEEAKQQACERILLVTQEATTKTKNHIQKKDAMNSSTTHVITKNLVKRISDLTLSHPFPVSSEVEGTTAVSNQVSSLWDELILEVNQIIDSFPTSLESDRKLMDKLNEFPSDTVYVRRGDIDSKCEDSHVLENIHQMKACLRYRMVKKQLYDDVKVILDKCS